MAGDSSTSTLGHASSRALAPRSSPNPTPEIWTTALPSLPVATPPSPTPTLSPIAPPPPTPSSLKSLAGSPSTSTRLIPHLLLPPHLQTQTLHPLHFPPSPPFPLPLFVALSRHEQRVFSPASSSYCSFLSPGTNSWGFPPPELSPSTALSTAPSSPFSILFSYWLSPIIFSRLFTPLHLLFPRPFINIVFPLL